MDSIFQVCKSILILSIIILPSQYVQFFLEKKLQPLKVDMRDRWLISHFLLGDHLKKRVKKDRVCETNKLFFVHGYLSPLHAIGLFLSRPVNVEIFLVPTRFLLTAGNVTVQ